MARTESCPIARCATPFPLALSRQCPVRCSHKACFWRPGLNPGLNSLQLPDPPQQTDEELCAKTKERTGGSACIHAGEGSLQRPGKLRIRSRALAPVSRNPGAEAHF